MSSGEGGGGIFFFWGGGGGRARQRFFHSYSSMYFTEGPAILPPFEGGPYQYF